MSLDREAVLVDYLRTPFSRSRPKDPDKDLFNCWRMDQLAAKLVNTIIDRTKLNPASIDEVIVGTAIWFSKQILSADGIQYCWASYPSVSLRSRLIQPAVLPLTV